SISEFFDLNFEIEFNYNVTEEKAREIIKNSYGQLKKDDKILYWQKYYSVDKTESSKQKENIIKTNQISKHYHTIVESDNGSENKYDSDLQIESSAQHHNSEKNSDIECDSEDKFSELDSDDSDYTQMIIANHQELNINGKRKNDFDSLIDENELFNNNISEVEEEFKTKKQKFDSI
ncbi:23711_t:CDS:2, partial [Dentiscutata erythropus]